MKRSFASRVLTLAGAVLISQSAVAQAHKVETHSSPDGKYSYTTVTNDPTQTRQYVLANGLTVFLSVNKAEPRVQTYIGVRAGSKNDPADATGLAHYLEHILFKGTDRYGSLDYSKEKPLLDQIEQLYEKYRATRDEAARAAIYHQIDSISGVAARYAIANEYDKMLSAIGARGTNAFTSFEQTVYVNDIPANQIDKWLSIEAERFRNPVIRLFHTELEAVYEEKNRALDNDRRLVMEAMLALVFPTHNYGQQTTIGTIDHLKNPSITRIKEYFSRYYVPNNMAIVMAGDLDPDKVIVMIDQKWGSFQRKEVVPYRPADEAPLQGPIEREVIGPDAENVTICYRFPGIRHHDIRVLKVMDAILSNAKAGLIDLNLNKQQRVLSASSSTMELSDYTVFMMSGSPKAGQSLEEVRRMLLEQVELLKQGKFDDALIPAVLNEMEISEMRNFETNAGRVSTLMSAYTTYTGWAEYLSWTEEMRAVTREEIVRFANEHLKDNYAVVYKRTGTRPDMQKVVKPPITPVEVNREARSPFLSSLVATPATPIQPVFLDFKKDVKTAQIACGAPIYYVANRENQLFTMLVEFEAGKLHDKLYPFAFNYLSFIGSTKRSAEDYSKAFYQLGTNYSFTVNNDRIELMITGLGKNLKASLELLQELLNNAQADDGALDAFLARVEKSRKDIKLNKQVVLNSAMLNYVQYGPENPYNFTPAADDLKNISSKDLIALIQGLSGIRHNVYFYGPNELKEVQAALDARGIKSPLRAAPAQTVYKPLETRENTVYFLNFDMVQAEVMWVNRSVVYNPAAQPNMSLFNEYFGGGMSGIVFQTIRESKALAYSTWARYTTPAIEGDPCWMTAYVGTQADKIHESVGAMQELLNTFPSSENLFKSAKESMENKYRSERSIRWNILMAYKNAMRQGISYDIRKNIFTALPSMTLKTVQDFHAKNVANRPYALLVLGSRDKIDVASLAKYGKVVELSMEDVFGF